MTKYSKLEQFAERELRKNITSMIIDDDEGGLIIFGKYRMFPTRNAVSVMTLDEKIINFSNKRTAMSWCVADSKNNINLANVIYHLDTKKQILDADIRCRSGVADRGRYQDFYDIVNTKIQPKVDMYNSVTRELEKCLNSAKYLQLKGFNNETARISKPA